MEHVLDAVYVIRFGAHLPERVAGAFREIPGVAVWQRSPGLTVPFNAGWLAREMLQAAGVRYTVTVKGARDGGPPFEDAWKDAVETGRLSSHAAKWAVPFQLDIIRTRYLTGGGTIHAPGGCIAGDATVILNRAGKGFRLSLAEAVRRFGVGGAKGNRRRDDIETTVQAMDEHGVGRKYKLIAAVESGVKPVFRLRAGAFEVKATDDHPFWTDAGWTPLRDIRPGDRVYRMVPAKEARRERAPRKRYTNITRMKAHPYSRYVPSKGYEVDVHRLVAEARLNEMAYDVFVTRIIDKNIDGLKFIDPKTHHVHHENEDHLDNRPENLVVLTVQEHLAHHANDGAMRHVMWKRRAIAVDSIEPAGEEMTYDLTVEGVHNFTANGFVVHNSGKTWMMLAESALWNVPTLVLGPAKVLGQWEEESKNEACMGPAFAFYGWRAESGMRRRHRPIEDYLAECKDTGRPPRIFASYTLQEERMAQLMAIAAGGAIFLDEVHTVKAPDRLDWAVTYDEAGDMDFASTPKGNRTAAAWQLAMAARYRVGATATPISIGVVDLWGQLSLIESTWGSTASRFKQRYADMIPGPFGGFVSSPTGPGFAHLDELKARMSFARSMVSMALTHAQLPPRRRRMTIVPLSEQVKETGGWHREMAALRKAGGESEIMLSEMHRARASSRKRRFAADRIVEAIKGGQKVLSFTGRKRDAEELAALVANRLKVPVLSDGAPPTGPPVWMAHGDMSGDDREDIRRAYMKYEGGCALIGTWQAWGEGLNLHDTDLHLFVMLPGTPRELLQGEWRSYRLGMKRALLVEYLIAEDSYDDRILVTLLKRLPLVETLADGAAIDGLVAVLEGVGDDSTFRADFMAYLAGLEGTPAGADDDEPAEVA